MNLKVWWVPQLPMNEPFEVVVSSIEEGKKLCDVLAAYDLYQFNNNIKPDYSNTGGVVYYDKEFNEWTDIEVLEDET